MKRNWIVTFPLLTLALAACGQEARRMDPVDLDSAGRTCASTHALVGRSFPLTTRSHGVRGNVTVINDCQLRFEPFEYDGRGIDVRVYTGQNRDFKQGASLSENLVGTEFNGEPLTVSLPEGLTLDDFDSVSIWCTDVEVSFGDALLR